MLALRQLSRRIDKPLAFVGRGNSNRILLARHEPAMPLLLARESFLPATRQQYLSAGFLEQIINQGCGKSPRCENILADYCGTLLTLRSLGHLHSQIEDGFKQSPWHDYPQTEAEAETSKNTSTESSRNPRPFQILSTDIPRRKIDPSSWPDRPPGKNTKYPSRHVNGHQL